LLRLFEDSLLQVVWILYSKTRLLASSEHIVLIIVVRIVSSRTSRTDVA
jgi:hypothetical protein